MKILRVLTGVLAVAGLVSAGLLLLAASWWNADDWKYYIALIDRSRSLVAVAGASYVGFAVFFVIAMLPSRRGDQIYFEREGGMVSIAARVVEEYVARLAPDFPAITKMAPKVTSLGDGIDIVVDVRIKAGPQIKEICDILQQKVRESVVTGLGITQVKCVEINVRKIVGQTEPDLKSMSDDEGL